MNSSLYTQPPGVKGLDQSWVWRNVVVAVTDAEARREGYPAFEAMQAHRQAAAVVEVDGAGEAEIPVKPAIEQHAAIDLDPELQAAFAVVSGPRLEAQMRAVGVGADQTEALRRGSAQDEGHERRAAADVETPAGQIPGRAGGVERMESVALEIVGKAVGRVRGARRSVDETAQVADEIHA